MKPIKKLNQYGFKGWTHPYNGNDFLVLSAFFPTCEKMTIKQIMDATGFTYEPTHRCLKSLDNSFVNEEKIGNVHRYSINTKNVMAPAAYAQYTFFRRLDFMEKYKRVYLALKELGEQKKRCSLIVYGEYAKLSAKREDVLNVLLVGDPMDTILKKSRIDYKKEKDRFNEKIKPVKLDFQIFDYFDFIKLKETETEFWEKIKNEGIVIEGWYNLYSYYYDQV